MPQYSEHSPIYDQKRGKSRRDVLKTLAPVFLVILPWLMFTLIACLIVISFHHMHALVGCLIACCGALCVVFVVLGLRGKSSHSRFFLGLGMLCLFANATSTIIGFYVYQEFTANFWAAEERRTFNNVRPDESATSLKDAGRIIFSEDSFLDTNRSVGYEDEGTVYCVAPVVSDTVGEKGGEVQFWAGGEDCCKDRGSFACDEALDKNVRGGAVIVDASPLFPGVVPKYRLAAAEAEAAFNLKGAADSIFVKWVADPQALQDSYFESSIHFIGLASLMHFVISGTFGVVLSMTKRVSL